MKPTARRRLGKYVLLGRLGHGGMGKIYLAYAPGPAGIEKLLVVKRLHSHLTNDPVLVNSFLDEARLSMALNHPNIVHTFDVGDVEGRYFMVMEYIDGQNLGVVLRTAKRSGGYPPSSLWSGLFLQVLDGLHAAHTAHDARGRPLHIIHRDVSPQNVLVTYEGLPKLVDFGIAKAAMRVSETDAGVLKGKYAYMSPEQVRGEGLDARSDVFAAGIVLWEMLAGRRLYKADTIVRSVERILTEPPISPVRVNADCDPEIAKVAFKALQKDREDRFASALEFKEALEEAMGGHRPRQTDVRDLMHRLFNDVIERQRAAIEQCLNQADADAPVAVDDDDHGDHGDHGDHERRKSDSESDLSFQRLKAERDAGENTTPSVHRASPLVTQEGERASGGGGGRTSLERKRGSKSSGKQPLIVDADAAPDEPPPQFSIAPAEITQTQSNIPPKGSSVAPFVLGALAVVVVGALIAVVVRLVRVDESPIALGGENATPVAEAKPLDETKPVAPLEETKPVAPGEDTKAGDDGDARESVNEDDGNGQDEGKLDGKADGKSDGKSDGKADGKSDGKADGKIENRNESRNENKLDRRKSFVRQVVAKKATSEKPKEEEETVAASAIPAGELGTLSLDTVPWTTVYLGKKKLGETPLVNVAVPAGTLELLLVNSEEGIRESYIAKVKAGQLYKARLDLH